MVGEGVNHLKRAATDGDVLARLSILSCDVCLFQTDGQPELLMGVRQMIN